MKRMKSFELHITELKEVNHRVEEHVYLPPCDDTVPQDIIYSIKSHKINNRVDRQIIFMNLNPINYVMSRLEEKDEKVICVIMAVSRGKYEIIFSFEGVINTPEYDQNISNFTNAVEVLIADMKFVA